MRFCLVIPPPHWGRPGVLLLWAVLCDTRLVGAPGAFMGVGGGLLQRSMHRGLLLWGLLQQLQHFRSGWQCPPPPANGGVSQSKEHLIRGRAPLYPGACWRRGASRRK